MTWLRSPRNFHQSAFLRFSVSFSFSHFTIIDKGAGSAEGQGSQQGCTEPGHGVGQRGWGWGSASVTQKGEKRVRKAATADPREGGEWFTTFAVAWRAGAAGLDCTSARPAPTPRRRRVRRRGQARRHEAPPRLHVLRLALVSEGPAMARPSRGKGGPRGPSSKLLPPEVFVDYDTRRCSRSREH